MITLWAGGCLFGVAVAVAADGSGGLGMPGTIGIVGVAQDATADAEHHGPMPAHQGCKRRLVAADGEVVQ